MSIIVVNDLNRLSVIANLSVGDLVSYRVRSQTAKDNKSGVVISLEYGFHSNLPIIHIVGNNADDFDCLEYGFHSSWLTEVTYGGSNKRPPKYYTPMLPLCLLYDYDSLVIRTLFNAYGHNHSWFNTLYDIGAIENVVLTCGYDIFNRNLTTGDKKKIKKIILRVANKHKMTRTEYQKKYLIEERELMEDDYEYDYND